VLLTRLFTLLSNETFTAQMEKAEENSHGSTSLDRAILKALCFSQIWLKQIELQQENDQDELSQKNSSPSRILVVYMSEDHHAHYKKIVNAIFACQKLSICIDCLSMD